MEKSGKSELIGENQYHLTSSDLQEDEDEEEEFLDDLDAIEEDW